MAEQAKKQGYMGMWFAEYYWQVSAVVALVFAVAGYLFLVGPKISEGRVLAGTQLPRERERGLELSNTLRALLELEEDRALIPESDIRRVAEILPTDPRLPELLASLEAIAVASGVVIEGVEFAFLEPEADIRPARGGQSAPDSESALPAGVVAVEANLRIINSPYANVKQFLGNTEKSLRLMDVTGVLYSPSAKNYTVTLQSYYQP